MAMPGRPVSPPGLLRQIDGMARAVVPTGSVVLLLVAAVVPVGVPGLAGAVAWAGVFFWSVFRPAGLPPPAVFGLGLLLDLLTAGPLGAGVLVLLAVHALAARGRRVLAGASFALVWLTYGAFAVGAASLGWVLQAALGWRLPAPAPGLVQALLSVGLYPALALALTAVHRAMERAEAA